MGTCVGVDGTKDGWYWVRLTEDSFAAGVAPTAAGILEQHPGAGLILIDVPIGLVESGDPHRACDRAARKALGRPRASSVFSPPCRHALSAGTYEEASRINRARIGRGLSKQSWGIVPKIREVDDLMRSSEEARGRVREVHPEVCFWALAGGRPMEHRKGKSAGVEERLAVLEAAYPRARTIAEELLEARPPRVSRDDILDALVATVTGLVGGNELRTLPEAPARDSAGLPLEMVYAWRE